MGVKVERFFVQRMKTKWGSCSPSSASIRLNTDLARKPRECLEYIVVHEMAHLVEPTRYPYQFAVNYQRYAQHVEQLPMDAHMLVALMAPRPVLLQTGNTDKWSDPKGEFLAAVAAEPVYRLFGKQGLGTDQLPPPGKAILHDIGYEMHDGGHGMVPSDWDVYLQFMKMHFQPEARP